MKAATFHDQTYDFTVHVLWNLNGPTLAAYLRRNFPEFEADEEDARDDWEGRHMKLEFDRHGEGYEVHLVVLRKFRLTPPDIAVLAHECLHATHEALSSCGITLCEETKEVYCCLHESLVRRCLEAIKK